MAFKIEDKEIYPVSLFL